jgi:SWI/SNF-related matrix-associated actin-dependent regulator of chromatin subfamily A-like protein 1
MQLKKYQQEDVATLLKRSKCFLALEQGLGKTAVSLVDSIAPVLVICPATLKFNWKAESAMWRPEYKAQVIDSKTQSFDSSANLYIVNYDILSKHIAKIPDAIKTLIVDEAHYCKNPSAKRTKIVSNLIKRFERVRLLSGTPVVNRPMDLFAMLKAIGAIKMDYMSFGRRYCSGWQTPWGSFDVSGSSNLEELYEKLEPVMIRRTKKSALPELPDKTYRIIELDLPLDKREKDFAQKSIALADHQVSFQALSDILKLNAQRKLPLAIEHIENILESEQKVLVFAWHTEIVEEVARLLSKYNSVSITGSTSLTKRQEAVDAFQHGDARILVGNIKAAGVGLTLTSASYVVFVESTWTPTDIDQCADRCHRIGQTKHVQVDILTIHKSIDAQQLHKVLDKVKIINSLVKEKDMSLQSAAIKLMDSANALAEALDLLKDAIPSEAAENVKGTKPAKPAKSAEPAKPKIKLDDLREKAADAIEEHGEDHVLDLLDHFGVTKLSLLPEDKYADFLEAL